MKALALAKVLATGVAVISAGGATAAMADNSAQEQAATRALNLEQSAKSPLQMPQMADAVPAAPLTAMVPLNQVDSVPEQVATARVTDPDGKMIGAVQKVEIENGRAIKVDIALIGAESVIALDAGSLRYNAAANVVATSETATQLMARPKA